ncbi:hypothetical protein E3T43_01165 [Cryobacterium sp. Hh7]|uniref:hypothetical protein n=1 Tax=Cryobacterium sp. Hh7 TaxID=1259159 RepID=UPI001069CEF9|nr:hypothetical protein [Cryobacterium sp. Hh7]TFD61110.1 hypothetical protein E3T43_01165 [Cryobacterium sp. Hh7]
MSDYDGIYYDGIYYVAHTEATRVYGGDAMHDHYCHAAGLAAVVVSAKAEALEEVAVRVLGPSDYLRDASTCRQIANDLRARAAEIREATT